MKTKNICRILLLLAILVNLTHASGWWMDQPYGEPANFNQDVEYEQNITLECIDERTSGINGQLVHWVRPDLTVMVNGDTDFFKTLDGSAGWVAVDDKLTLQFIQEAHFGFYYCLLQDLATNDNIYVKIGVNYQGPFFGDLWEDYRMNVIIGCSAAGGFLLACGIIYIVQHFCLDSGSKYDDDEDDEDEYGGVKVPDVSISYPGISNGSYVSNEKGGIIDDKKGNDYSINEDTTQL